MKHQWTIRRAGTETVDAHQRWDRAYQCLLRWGYLGWAEQSAGVALDHEFGQEVRDARGGICAGIESEPGSGTDH